MSKSYNSLKSAKCLKVLLEGVILNRKNIDKYNVGEWNSSLHSTISYIQNKRLVPVISERASSRINSYSMNKYEITRFNNPNQRPIQEEETRAQVETKRQGKAIKRFLSTVDHLIFQPSCRTYRNNLLCEIKECIKMAQTLHDEMIKENASLNKKKGDV